MCPSVALLTLPDYNNYGFSSFEYLPHILRKFFFLVPIICVRQERKTTMCYSQGRCLAGTITISHYGPCSTSLLKPLVGMNQLVVEAFSVSVLSSVFSSCMVSSIWQTLSTALKQECDNAFHQNYLKCKNTETHDTGSNVKGSGEREYHKELDFEHEN